MKPERRSFLWRWWNNFLNSRLYFRTYRFFRIYFNFNRSEQRGLIVLLVVIVILLLLDVNALNFGREQQTTLDDSVFIRRVDSFLVSLQPKPRKDYGSRLDEFIRKRYDTLQLFRFDPNTATADELRRLGLTDKQVRNVLNYRSKGGKFRYKEDFARLYTIRRVQYQFLEPYIALPDRQEVVSEFASSPEEKLRPSRDSVRLFVFDPNTIPVDSLVLLGFSPKQAQVIDKLRKKGWKFRKKSDFARLYVVSDSVYQVLKNYIDLPDSLPEKGKYTGRAPKIELNTATVEQLVDLGYTRQEARDIISYREYLGGYVTTYQLYEKGTIRSEIIKKTYWRFTIDKSLLRKINLKTATYDELVRHPYISKDFARWIVNRQKRKKFNSLDYLRNSPYFPKYKWKKLREYVYVK